MDISEIISAFRSSHKPFQHSSPTDCFGCNDLGLVLLWVFEEKKKKGKKWYITGVLENVYLFVQPVSYWPLTNQKGRGLQTEPGLPNQYGSHHHWADITYWCVCVSLWWALEWAGKPVFCYCLHHHSQPKRADLITDTEWASFPTGWRLNTDYSSQVSRFIRGLWSVYHNMQTAAIKSTDLGEFFNLLLPNLKFNPLQFQNYWYPLTE